MVEFFKEIIVDLLLHIAHLEFLLSILANFGYPGTASLYVVLADTLAGCLVEFRQVVVVENELNILSGFASL